jgi:hypothetical protein
MPLPLIPVIIGGAALMGGGFGIKKGYDGVSGVLEAKRRAEDAQMRGKSAVEELERMRDRVNACADAYGRQMSAVRAKTFGMFISFVEALGQRGSVKAIEALDEVSVTYPDVKELRIEAMKPHSLAGGTFTMIGAATGAGAGATGLIGLLGTASTGTAISTLGGAAASNATLAWLGGGAVAAGGGGMAVGTLVLGGIVAAPACIMGGLVLAREGAKALRQATEYEAGVEDEIAKINQVHDFLDAVTTRINELRGLVRRINRRACNALKGLDPAVFDVDNDEDVAAFQRAGLLVKALADIMRTPVLGEDGHMTAESLAVQAKYRELTG